MYSAAPWQVTWNLSSEIYTPGSNGSITGNFLNSGYSDLSLDEIRLRLDWQESGWYDWEVGRTLGPNEHHYFSISFPIPADVIGVRNFYLGAVTRDVFPQFNLVSYGYQSQPSQNLGLPVFSETTEPGSLKIMPMPVYDAFVSRSVHHIDAPTVDPIVRTIEGWGFNPHTVGIDIFTDFANIPYAVRENIARSDCVIAIATKRDQSAITGLWKTLEWLHGEVGIAFGVDKPILVLRDYEVQLGGLPSSIPSWQIPFDVYNLQAVDRDLARRMPQFRKEIADKKSRDFWSGVAKVGVPLALGFFLGAALGSKGSKR